MTLVKFTKGYQGDVSLFQVKLIKLFMGISDSRPFKDIKNKNFLSNIRVKGKRPLDSLGLGLDCNCNVWYKMCGIIRT